MPRSGRRSSSGGIARQQVMPQAKARAVEVSPWSSLRHRQAPGQDGQRPGEALVLTHQIGEGRPRRLDWRGGLPGRGGVCGGIAHEVERDRVATKRPSTKTLGSFSVVWGSKRSSIWRPHSSGLTSRRPPQRTPGLADRASCAVEEELVDSLLARGGPQLRTARANARAARGRSSRACARGTRRSARRGASARARRR